MLKYLTACLPDYFQGFNGIHVYAIPVSKGETYKNVFNSLRKAIQEEEIYGFEDNYNKIETDLLAMIHIAKEQGYINSVFSEYIESEEPEVYAYFGVTSYD